jgi:phosphate-selective porin OprO/OprP
LKLGQFKVPFTWENLQSHKYLDFADRSIAVNNMRRPGRDIGGMLHGRIWDDSIQYQLAVLNGTGENTGDNNDAKDLAGRLAIRPFRSAEGEFLERFHLGVSGTWGNQDSDFSDTKFKTVPGTEFVTFASGTTHEGDRARLGAEFIWPIGPASLKAEWMKMWLDDFQMSSVEEDIDFSAWYISGTYILTGEKKGLKKTIPRNPFNPSLNMWGAWEIAARYSIFNSDDDLFKLGMATGTDRAETITLGLNWYLNEFLRITLNYEHTKFDDNLLIDGRTIDDEDAFLAQCQLEF